VRLAISGVIQDAAAGGRASSALAALLGQLRDLVALLPVHCYRTQTAPRVSGSVGAHVRHTLDHVSAFLAAAAGDAMAYDHRKRGTGVETDPCAALVAIERLLHELDTVDDGSLDRAVTLATQLDVTGPAVAVRTTLARELAFVIQHTIHHCALIALLLDAQAIAVPHGFGVAPSTDRARRAS
jgi:uncharacterized damage-inducible protein DinB